MVHLNTVIKLLKMVDPKKQKKPAAGSNDQDETDIGKLVREAILKIDNLSQVVDKNAKFAEENFKACKFGQDGIQEKLGNFIKEFELMKEEIDALKTSNSKLRDTVFDLTKKVNRFEWSSELGNREEKKSNLCLDGISEDINCNLEIVVNELFQDLGLDCKVRDVCQSIYRKGQVVNVNGKPKPRPVIVRFYEPFQKKKVFQNLKKLAGNDKWKNIFINDDLTKDQAEKMKDLRAINGFARSLGKDSKLKGSKLIVEGKLYGLDEVDKVPTDIKIEKAKNIEIMEGKGLAFQGHHSFLSNMSFAEFEYKGKEFKSVEVGYQYMRACANDLHEDASKIRKEADPYAAKRASRKFKDSEKWLNNREKIMKDLVAAKFSQNEDLKQKLINTGEKKLFECTEDKFWGCSTPISRAKSIDPKKMQGKNMLGTVLMEVRTKLSKK